MPIQTKNTEYWSLKSIDINISGESGECRSLTVIKINTSYKIYKIFAKIINGQLKQPSEKELDIWKWPITTAIWSQVKWN